MYHGIKVSSRALTTLVSQLDMRFEMSGTGAVELVGLRNTIGVGWGGRRSGRWSRARSAHDRALRVVEWKDRDDGLRGDTSRNCVCRLARSPIERRHGEVWGVAVDCEEGRQLRSAAQVGFGSGMVAGVFVGGNDKERNGG